jgi:hypothetical protein
MNTTITPERVGTRRNRREAQRKANRRKANRRIILEEKKRGCEICGRKDLPPECLEFHHRDGAMKKRRKVSSLVSAATAGLRYELSLCRLWCKWSHAHFHRTGEIKPCACAFAQTGGQIAQPPATKSP